MTEEVLVQFGYGGRVQVHCAVRVLYASDFLTE